MLFNSYEFIFAFVPVTLIVFYLLGRWQQPRIAIAWLVGASLFFYGWWNPAYLGLIIGSILFNYSFGLALSRGHNKNKYFILVFGIAGNLGLLGYYKYANFFIDNINLLSGINFNVGTIILPLAISFFTFQQITYLVDAYRGETREYNFLHYCLFVTFFPQLIAGPIVHHKEMLPQFGKRSVYAFHHENFSVGITIFVIGLFKKVVIADGISVFATPVFSAAASGTTLTFFEAWSGTLAYSFQLYFDFSGYSDMAIGIARMVGIHLPLNFHSPYKATSIIEFWRRWHMTLSRFLRDYLYIPLGGNRKGPSRRYVNLFITMLLGGLWHGAGWTFVLWGGLHGLYLVINHAWEKIKKMLSLEFNSRSWWSSIPARFLTFFAVAVGWVFFRAADFDSAISILHSMFAFDHIQLNDAFRNGLIEKPHRVRNWFIVLFCIVWLMPNTQQLLARYSPSLEPVEGTGGKLEWKPNLYWACGIIFLAIWAINNMDSISEFLYFQF